MFYDSGKPKMMLFFPLHSFHFEFQRISSMTKNLGLCWLLMINILYNLCGDWWWSITKKTITTWKIVLTSSVTVVLSGCLTGRNFGWHGPFSNNVIDMCIREQHASKIEICCVQRLCAAANVTLMGWNKTEISLVCCQPLQLVSKASWLTTQPGGEDHNNHMITTY